MTLTKTRSMVASAVLIGVIATARLADACAMCGLPLGDPAGRAYDASVLFTLAAPYLTIAAMGAVLFAARRRADRSRKSRAHDN